MHYQSATLRKILICLCLGIVTCAAYWPVSNCGFVSYDDQIYVTENIWVTRGLTWEGVKWAFSASHGSNWHPLTWLSHMLDVQLYGPMAAGHHWTNVFFHTTNTLLLFWFLNCMTGAIWRSAVVAGLFALHPLHVESVAWVAERKDVLSTFFGLLSLWAYVRYVGKQKQRAPNATVASSGFSFHGSIDYWLAFAFLALGLMSKPMLVTWPFLMLVLDYWPLKRMNLTASPARSNRVLLLEKLPLLLLSIGSCIVTCVAQQTVMATFPLTLRIQNALVSYAVYVQKMLWPSNLAVFYPYPDSIPLVTVLLAVLILTAISAAALMRARRQPYFLTGWLWFLGTLVPVIGILHVGMQAMADRYSYIPSIGIFVLIVWALEEASRTWKHRRTILVLASALALVACFILTRAQLRAWKNSESLFRKALSATQNNAIAHLNLGSALALQEKTTEAKEHFEAAVRIWPAFPDSRPYLGLMLIKLGQYDEAIFQFQTAVQLNPESARNHFQLANALDTRGRRDEAIDEYHRALAIEPNMRFAMNDLAWILATDTEPRRRNGLEAVTLAEQACRLTEFKDALFVGTLAAAYAEAGRFEDAVTTADRARGIALSENLKALADRNAQLMEQYRNRKPVRESVTPEMPVKPKE